jgi:zinc protease
MRNPVSAKRESVKSRTERDATKKVIRLLIFIFFVILGYPERLQADFSSGAQKFTLNNGMVVIIKELPDEELVNIGVFVRAGSSTEGKFLGSGISHLIEHMLFKGTKTRGVGEVEREIKSYGGRIDGFTSFDYTGYSITLPSQYFDKAIGIVGDCLLKPSFNEEELKKERGEF